MSRAAHREHTRVEWVDTDASGRIHNTVPLRWAEQAEHAFLRSVGLSAQPGLLRRRIEVDYLGELVFGDELVVDFRVERVGTSSLTFRWHGATDRGPVFAGSSVVVHVDDDGRPTPLPEQLRALMLAARDGAAARED